MLGFAPAQAAAGERLIVRTSGLLEGLPIVKSVCQLVGCQVLYGLDGTLGKLFLVSIPDALNVPLVINLLETVPGVSVELDSDTACTEGAMGTQAPWRSTTRSRSATTAPWSAAATCVSRPSRFSACWMLIGPTA